MNIHRTGSKSLKMGRSGIWRSEAPRSAVQSPILVVDLFTDADGTVLSAHTPDKAPAGSIWASNAATKISNNQVKPVGASYASASIETGKSNVKITFTCTNTAGSSNATMDSGMHLRIADGKYFRVGFNVWARAIRIYEYNGAWVLRASTSITPYPTGTTPYTLVVNALDSTISVTFEDSFTTTYGLATLNQTVTRHGLYLYKSGVDYGDNFSIEAI